LAKTVGFVWSSSADKFNILADVDNTIG